MNTIYKYLSLIIVLAVSTAVQGQTDEEVIVDTKNVKIIVKEKKIITTGKDGNDTVVTKTVERINVDPDMEGEDIEEIEIEREGSDKETEEVIIKMKKGDDDDEDIEDIEDYSIVINGDTLSAESSIKTVIKVMKEYDDEDIRVLKDNVAIEGENGEVDRSLSEIIETELEDLFEEDEKEIPFVETDWFNLQWGFTNLMNADNQLEMPEGSKLLEINPGNSANFQIHVVQQALNIYKGHVRLIYGVGVDWNNYRFNNNIDLIDTGGISWAASPNDYKKNKLVTRFLTVPVMLDFNIGKPGKEGFKIAMGANFGYNLGSHQKQKWSDDDGRHKVKTRKDYGVEQFRMGYEVQFGYGSFVLFGKYYPQSVFRDGLGPNLRSVSAGILIGRI